MSIILVKDAKDRAVIALRDALDTFMFGGLMPEQRNHVMALLDWLGQQDELQSLCEIRGGTSAVRITLEITPKRTMVPRETVQ